MDRRGGAPGGDPVLSAARQAVLERRPALPRNWGCGRANPIHHDNRQL